MKKILLSATILFAFSCKDNREDPVTPPVNLTGTWKIDRYEYKGSTFEVATCDKEDVITLQASMNGSYKNSELNAATNGCEVEENIVGSWNFSPLESTLIFKYSENNVVKSKVINLAEYSDVELKINVSNKNVDGIPGNDAALQVWKKQ